MVVSLQNCFSYNLRHTYWCSTERACLGIRGHQGQGGPFCSSFGGMSTDICGEDICVLLGILRIFHVCLQKIFCAENYTVVGKAKKVDL